ncbi:hypothetical protein JCM9279_004368 [Rhodotorula babjevae]
MNGEASFRPWSSLAGQAALGGGRVDAAFLTEPVPYEDFEYSTGVDFSAFPPPSSGSSAGAGTSHHLTRPFSPFHPDAAFASPRSRTASYPVAPPPPPGGAPEPAPLFDSTESALFSSFLTTLDVDPGFLFNPVLPPGMPSPPSTSAGPYGGGASDRDRHERDSLGRDVGGMHLRTTSAGTGSSTSAASTPLSSSVGGTAPPHASYLPPATLTAGPPLPPATLTAGPPPPPLSLRLPSPPRAAPAASSSEPRGRARGKKTERYAELDEDEDDDDDDPQAGRDSDSDFEPAKGGGAGSGSGSASGATGAAASAGTRRRTRASGGGGGGAAAVTAKKGGGARGGKKARVSEPAPAPPSLEGGDVDMAELDDEPALAAGLAAGRAKRAAAGARRGGARASLSRLPDVGDEHAALDDGSGDGTGAGAAFPPPPAAAAGSSAAVLPVPPPRSGNGKPVTLTESQKRSNHILSEQKRRNAIRIGFKDLVGLLLAGEGASGIVLGSSGAGGEGDDDEGGGAPATKKRKGKGMGSGRGRGRRGDVSTNASKSVVLTHAASYILWLERGNMALEQEVKRVEALLQAAHVEG